MKGLTNGIMGYIIAQHWGKPHNQFDNFKDIWYILDRHKGGRSVDSNRVGSLLFAPRRRHILTLEPDEDRVPNLIYCIDSTEHFILCTCGEADPSLWENELVIQAMRRFLRRGGDNHLIFAFARADVCKTPKQAVAALKENNPKLINTVGDYPDKVKIYWTPIRPRAHYAIFDNSVMFESEHDAYGKPKVTFIFDRPEIAMKWRRHFYEFIKYAEPLQVAN